MPHGANVGDMKLLVGWLEGVDADFPCLFWDLGDDERGCTPKAVPADAEVVLRIGNNDADWLIK